MHWWHVRTTSSSVHWGWKEKYGCAAKPTMFVPGWRLCKQNTYLSNAVYGSDIWNFSGLTLGLFSHNRIYPRMHPSCPPLPRHLPPCIRSSPLCNVHTAFIPRTQDPGPRTLISSPPGRFTAVFIHSTCLVFPSHNHNLHYILNCSTHRIIWLVTDCSLCVATLPRPHVLSGLPQHPHY